MALVTGVACICKRVDATRGERASFYEYMALQHKAHAASFSLAEVWADTFRIHKGLRWSIKDRPGCVVFAACHAGTVEFRAIVAS